MGYFERYPRGFGRIWDYLWRFWAGAKGSLWLFAVIFVVKVCTNLGMPEFNTTLLGLMGISNGTYLGFKLQGR